MSNYETMKRLGLTGQDVVDKHPGGRPPKPASERATAVVHVRVTAARKAAYVAAAKADGVSLSQWVQDGLDWIALLDEAKA